jgi:phage baseplate assembly protein gpV
MGISVSFTSHYQVVVQIMLSNYWLENLNAVTGESKKWKLPGANEVVVTTKICPGPVRF